MPPSLFNNLLLLLQINVEIMKSAVLTGVTPLIHVETKFFDVDQFHSGGVAHQLSGALVEMTNHSCDCVKHTHGIEYYRSVKSLASIILSPELLEATVP